MDEALVEKLTALENSLGEIEAELQKIDISSDPKAYAELAKRHSDVTAIVVLFNEWRTLNGDIADAEEMLKSEEDIDMKTELEELVSESKSSIVDLTENIKIALLPKDPLDEKDVLVEIRPGAGGEEAAIWVGDLYKMYTRFAERNAWNVEPIELTASDQGGYNKIIFSIKSKGVYSKLKFEAGAHRVQRIPKTESQGRVHTSIATVAVLPEAEEVDLSIAANDLKIDVYRSSGPGGQSVNTTDSAVRITHLETGIVVACQAERSQLQNKTRALELLKTKLILKQKEEELLKINNIRGDQHEAGWGRQIRSYVLQPYQQVKDSRSNTEVGNVDSVLDGDISLFVKDYLKWRRQGIND